LVTGRGKAGHVTNDTATQGDHSAIASESIRDEDVEDSPDRGQSLVRLAVRKDGFNETAAAQRLNQRSHIERWDSGIADDENVSRGHVLPDEIRLTKQAFSDQDGVAAITQFDFERVHPASLTAHLGSVEFPENVFRDGANPAVVGQNGNVRDLGVQGRLDLHEGLQPGGRVYIAEQWPGPTLPDARDLLRHRGFQVHDATAFGQDAAVLGQEDRASAGGHDDPFHGGQDLEGFVLALTKTGFALFLEDVGDIDAGAALDLEVTVIKGTAQHPGELFSDGAFAGSHGSDEEEVGFGEHAARSIPKTPRPPEGGRT